MSSLKWFVRLSLTWTRSEQLPLSPNYVTVISQTSLLLELFHSKGSREIKASALYGRISVRVFKKKKKMEKKENLMSSKDCKCYFFRLTLFADWIVGNIRWVEIRGKIDVKQINWSVWRSRNTSTRELLYISVESSVACYPLSAI